MNAAQSSADSSSNQPPAGSSSKWTRRGAMKALGVAVGAAAFAKAAEPLGRWAANQSIDDFLQQHYQELTPEQKQAIFQRIEQQTLEEYGAEVTVTDDAPLPNVKFGYAINLSICIGCRKCAEACHHENNHDRPSQQSYIRVMEMKKGAIDLDEAQANYDHPVPDDEHFYMPVQCQQCDNPHCVTACPVEATWKEDDGLVVVDYNWCIGCRYCEAACPYHARRFNWERPEIPADEVNPDVGYLSNRIRPLGVIEKCTFCLHRTRRGMLPACLEACPAGARVFGNLRDPESEIRWVLANKRVFVLKEEVGTQPNFFYFFDE